ncbi:MAG: hypothetical protein JKY15_05130 [Deltaproteobacteria bacterium]|nr:hypothetical protein [Deltaproteobacteria bacterium]
MGEIIGGKPEFHMPDMEQLKPQLKPPSAGEGARAEELVGWTDAQSNMAQVLSDQLSGKDSIDPNIHEILQGRAPLALPEDIQAKVNANGDPILDFHGLEVEPPAGFHLVKSQDGQLASLVLTPGFHGSGEKSTIALDPAGQLAAQDAAKAGRGAASSKTPYITPTPVEHKTKLTPEQIKAEAAQEQRAAAEAAARAKALKVEKDKVSTAEKIDKPTKSTEGKQPEAIQGEKKVPVGEGMTAAEVGAEADRIQGIVTAAKSTDAKAEAAKTISEQQAQTVGAAAGQVAAMTGGQQSQQQQQQEERRQAQATTVGQQMTDEAEHRVGDAGNVSGQTPGKSEK